ncbi:DNA methyltransferase [Microbacterium oxydans]|uniref:DNA methyltransferase n=1 Tax=Microbacterium oxydans TaxID=82380 RepID=UPI000F8F992C|nr:DNA methyltransferase [Microbacterium oxydans]AZS46650.1 hypothetical protein CVS53_01324 [Microbacterium oxydans]
MTLHYEDGGFRLFHGSNKDVLGADVLGYPFELGYNPDRLIPDASFDSIVTDPPYELGFMGKGWDSTGIAYDVDMWRECFRVLKPGGYLLAFGGTRTWHRIAVAIEDAGFEVRDSIAWMYGSGFPKSMDVAKAIDKMDATDERRARALEFTTWMRSTGITAKRIDDLTSSFMGGHYLTTQIQAAIPTADMFDRLRSDLPEVPARIEQLVADRTVESKNFAAREVIGERTTGRGTGSGSVSVITDNPENRTITAAHTEAARQWEGWGTALKPAFEPIIVARKPIAGTVAANVLAYGTGAINIDATRVPGQKVRTTRNTALGVMNDDGWVPTPGTYETPDAGRFPPNVLLDESQAALLDGQSGLLSSGTMRAGTRRQSRGGAIYGKDAENVVSGDTYGDSGGASRFFPTFRYEAKAPGSERPEVDGVAHATVKPLDLMRWLVRLVTRRGGHVLDPFAGSGTTGEAALLEGMESTLIEYEEAHLPLILARVRKPLQPSMFGDWEEAS